MMKETPGSLRAYFVVAGLLSGWVGGNAIANARGLVLVSDVLSLGMGVAFVVAAMMLQGALVTGARWILNMLLIDGVLLLLNSALLQIAIGGTVPMVAGGLGVLITWYLYVNVRRLSAEAQPQTGATC